jgi:ribosome-associated protein
MTRIDQWHESHETHLRINDQLSVPRAELRFQFTTSGGPGGQHANRSATRVELFFDVANSPSLSDAQREQAMAALKGYIDSQGVLRLVSQASRSQAQNREEVTARFQALLAEALKPRKRRRRTRVPPAERERRLAEKRRRGERKRLRGPVSPDE